MMFSDKSIFLDTVRLVIPLTCRITDFKNPFGGRMWDTYQKEWGTEYVINDRYRRKQQEGYCEYLPMAKYRERINKGFIYYEIVVEFSVPKLVNSQNFTPVAPSDVKIVYLRLLDILSHIYGFDSLSISDIRQATLSRIDCSVVVMFENHLALQQALDRIKTTELDSRLDIDEPSFSPTSRGVSISCNAWQFCFYNKTAEYKKSIDIIKSAGFYPNNVEGIRQNRDNIHIQGSTLSNGLKYEQKWDFSILPIPVIEKHRQGFEFMQCELRLNTKAKINRALDRIEVDRRHLTLDILIREKIPLRILRYHWGMITDGLPRNDIRMASIKDVSATLMQSKLRPKEILETIGRIQLFQMYDMQELKDLYIMGHGRSGWKRLKESVADIPILSNEKDPVQPITEAIFGAIEDSRVTCFHDRQFAISITNTLCIKKSPFLHSDRMGFTGRELTNSRAPPQPPIDRFNIRTTFVK